MSLEGTEIRKFKRRGQGVSISQHIISRLLSYWYMDEEQADVEEQEPYLRLGYEEMSGLPR